MAHPIVTLLTDFGLQDNSVGAMKGVICGICREARIEDICHWVPPQNIAVGGFLLERTFFYYPAGTVHVAVVDPGVGSARRPVAMRCAGHYFVAPDNGLLTQVLDAAGGAGEACLVELAHPDYRLKEVSDTFHGRDIFAPAAAHLAAGVPLERLGPKVTDPVRLPGSKPERAGADGLKIHVVYVDRFGNLITDLPGSAARDLEREWGGLQFRVGGQAIGPLRRTYSAAAPGERVAVVGGFDRVEIAINQGDARTALGAGPGDTVEVRAGSGDLS